jgi:hypothetical protein
VDECKPLLYGSTRFNEAGKLVPDGVKSVGVRQRVHEVEARADGWFVRLRLGGEAGPGKCCPLSGAYTRPLFGST